MFTCTKFGGVAHWNFLEKIRRDALSQESDQTMRLALILKTDAQGSIAAVKHMFSEVTLVCMDFSRHTAIMDLTSAPIFVGLPETYRFAQFAQFALTFRNPNLKVLPFQIFRQGETQSM